MDTQKITGPQVGSIDSGVFIDLPGLGLGGTAGREEGVVVEHNLCVHVLVVFKATLWSFS